MPRRVQLFTVGWFPPSLTTLREFRDFALVWKRIFELRIAPYLRSGVSRWVVLNEYMSIFASGLGERGALARTQSTSEQAMGAILNSYPEAVDDILSRCGISHPGQLATLALTDTVWDCLYSIFSYLAVLYNANVVFSANLPGRMVQTENPQLVSAYSHSPSMPKSRVWIPDQASPEPGNFSVLIRPDGTYELIRKIHLTKEEESIGLVRGLPGQKRVFEGVGIATCFEAWFEDVIKELVQQEARIILVPMAGSNGWATMEQGDNPRFQVEANMDVMLGLFKYPGIEAVATSGLRGNILEFSFDCQTSIAVRSESYPKRRPIGTPPKYLPGRFVHLDHWVETGRLPSNLIARRQRLLAIGAELRPGGRRENQYRSTSVGEGIIKVPD